jgi:hypothetical protein
MPRSPAQVSLVLDGEDQVARLERFRATHPDVPVLLQGPCPKAWVGDSPPQRRGVRGRSAGELSRQKACGMGAGRARRAGLRVYTVDNHVAPAAL